MLDTGSTLDKLIAVLENERDSKSRAYCAFSIGLLSLEESDKKKAVAALTKIVLADKHYLPRAVACLAISQFREVKSVIDVLKKALANDRHTDVQGFALIALGMYRGVSSSRLIRDKINSRRNSPLSYAGFMALGLTRETANFGMLQMEFDFATSPLEYESLSFAMAKCSGGQGWYSTLRFLDSKGIYITEFAAKSLGMTENLPEEVRCNIIARLKLFAEVGKIRKVNNDTITRFYAAVVRYSLGDHSAVEEIIRVMRVNDFFLGSVREMNWVPLMDTISQRFAEHYTIAPFFWSDTD